MQVTSHDHQTGFSTVSVYERVPSRNLDRVAARLTPMILRFFDTLKPGFQFHAEDLRALFIHEGVTCSPESPTRVMRDLKRKGLLNYRVVSRAKSLYEVLDNSRKEENTDGK